MDIFHFKIDQKAFGPKEGFLIHEMGAWSEVSPLPGRSRETLTEVLHQLKTLDGPLYPSVEFGLFGLAAPKISHSPVSLFLMGTPQEILKQAKRSNGCTSAKLKLGTVDLPTAIFLVRLLKQDFRLRIDLHGWDKNQVHEFCAHFSPADFEYIEDPGCDISPFPMASDDGHFGSTLVWKPMVRGLPNKKTPVILSSSYETGIGLHHIAALSQSLEIPAHPLGIGTFLNLSEDLLQDPLEIRDGNVYFPDFKIKKELLTRC